MQENEQVYEAILEAIRENQPACALTVIEVNGSTPRGVGAKMLLRADGSTVGTIGGGALEAAALADGRQALESGASRVTTYSLRAQDESGPSARGGAAPSARGGAAPSARGSAALGVCGGEARVFIEVLQLRSTLLIAGGGHVSQPLAELGHVLGFRIVVVDDRPEFVERARFPHADELLAIAFDQLIQRVKITEQTYAVIVTRGHEYDHLVLRQLLDTRAAYIGMIGSRKKVRTVFDHLLAEGVPEGKLAQVYAPVGLRTGGRTPVEIALSILAEIVLVQNGGTGEPLSWRDNPLRERAPTNHSRESAA